MKAQRELLPAGLAAASSASSERESTPQSTAGGSGGNGGASAPRRRPQTKIACTSCRRRKSKCDGQRPVCSLCAGMGRTKCEYDAGPDVTRFAALKSKHEELQGRIALFEELFRLLSMRSEAESIEIIRRMRTANMETDLDDLVKFIKNADLLIQLASTPSKQTTPAPRAADADSHGQVPMDELSSLLETLKSAFSELDTPARTAFLDTIRLQIDAFTSRYGGRLESTPTVKAEVMTDRDMAAEPDGMPESRPGEFLKGLLNDDTTRR
ncbi:nitrogen assimilation transcription factor [Colletotrichum truncatum]|uniref:Nitrogen assimilation transcription factor n=1 Tax=Colletotrichum truncatum TaxID=5467 RepID=A0ACC3Z0S7_COLTU|nr:nitrogen assimilation transcription factor [Colletotrichum truncatum]KAF6800548.1 nitrogen assimilation transcription factor [Colletotrichum truncatum]